MGIMNYLLRPLIGEQSTERLAWLGYQGLARTSVNGTGFVTGKMNATSYTNLAPGPSAKLVDLAVTGNNAGSVKLQPLTDNRSM